MQSKQNRWIPFFTVAAVVSVAACTVEVVSLDERDAGGAGGSAGAPAADAGADREVPDALASDAGLDALAVLDAASDAATESTVDGGDATADAADASACYAEDPVPVGPVVDGGDGRPPCEALPYFGDQCTETFDAGPMNVAAYGVRVCEQFRGELKLSAYQELFDCLKQIPAGAENCRYDRGNACVARIFGHATCDVPAFTTDGGAFGCTEIAAACPAADGGRGVALADCVRWLHPFSAKVRQLAFDCYTLPDNASVPCGERFEDYCVFPEDIRP
jgi:hypothetical protein